MELVLYNIRSRFNVGAIFRTADAAGVRKVYLCGITPQPPHPQIDKVALGAEKFIPFIHQRQTLRLLKQLKKSGYKLVALEQSKKSIPYYKYKYSKKEKVVLILGSEVKGLSPKVLSIVDAVVEIPMYGQKESLNVAIAAGIVMFDWIKNR